MPAAKRCPLVSDSYKSYSTELKLPYSQKKNYLFVDDTPPANIDQDGTSGKEVEPLLVNHPTGGGGARQGHHQHLGSGKQGVQAGNRMDSHPVLPDVLLLDGGAHPDNVEPEANAGSTHEGSDPAVAEHQGSSATQQHLQVGCCCLM